MHYIVVDCGSLTAPDNGQVSVTTTTYTSTADYTCDTGYSLVGVNQRNCTAAGTWTDGVPTCDSKSNCTVLFVDENTVIPIGVTS